jgi:hypothetical protein
METAILCPILAVSETLHDLVSFAVLGAESRESFGPRCPVKTNRACYFADTVTTRLCQHLV